MPTSATAGADAEDPFPDTVEEIVSALRQDPVLITEMLGNGATAELDQALHEKLDDARVPVYVVLTRTPVGLDPVSADEELTSLVHAELGRDEAAVYVVRTSLGLGHVGVYGDVDPSVDDDGISVSLAQSTALDQVRAEVEQAWGPDTPLAPAAEAGVVLDIASRSTIPDYRQPVLSEAEVAGYAGAQWRSLGYGPYEDDAAELPEVGLSSLLAVSVGLTVAIVGFRLSRALTAPRRPRAAAAVAAPLPPDRRARALEAIEALVSDLEGDRASRIPGDRLAGAIGCRDVALQVVESDDDLDLVGATVLARTGSHAVRGDGPDPYRCCYVNPEHGRARHRAKLPGGVSVPVCRSCQSDVEAGRTLDALTERRRGRDRPYYAGDSVWARTGFGALSDELWLDVRRERAR